MVTTQTLVSSQRLLCEKVVARAKVLTDQLGSASCSDHTVTQTLVSDQRLSCEKLVARAKVLTDQLGSACYSDLPK